MFDIGFGELLLIGIVSLIVVGPRDLPGMFRTLGRFTAKARAMGREFQRAMDDAARETGVKDAVDDLRVMTSKKNLGLDALDKAAAKFEKWEPTKPAKPAATPKGPATQALAEKKAKETADRLAKLADKARAEAEAVAAAGTPAPKSAGAAPTKTAAAQAPATGPGADARKGDA